MERCGIVKSCRGVAVEIQVGGADIAMTGRQGLGSRTPPGKGNVTYRIDGGGFFPCDFDSCILDE